jgi:hypothetical protein
MHDLGELLGRACAVAVECAKGDTQVEAFIVAIPDKGRPLTLFIDKEDEDHADDPEDLSDMITSWLDGHGAERWFSIAQETVPTSEGHREVVICTAFVNGEQAQLVLLIARDKAGKIADLVDVGDMVDDIPWTVH